MNKKILFLYVVIAIAINAAPTSCRGIYFDNNAPDILNPKLAPKTKELCYDEFAVMHSGISRTPLWSAEYLVGSKLNIKVDRTNDFRPEMRLSASDRAELSDYARSGYDRGHMAPARDFNTIQAESECFSLANMIPQNSNNNRKLWAGIEEATRALAKQKGKLYVVTGPIFEGSNLQRIGGRVLVPTKIFKAIYDPTDNQGAAYLVNNAPGNNYQVVSIAQVEQIAGIRIFPKMSPASKKNAMQLLALQKNENQHLIGEMASSNNRVKPMVLAYNKPASSMQCGIRKTCSKMSSCEEAMFYFHKCGDGRLDRNKDGIPCNKLCR